MVCKPRGHFAFKWAFGNLGYPFVSVAGRDPLSALPNNGLSGEDLVSTLADFVGVGALVKVVTEDAENIALCRAPSIGLFENIPNLYLQTSLFSLTFHETSDATKYQQLLSIAISGSVTIKLAVDVTWLLIRKWGVDFHLRCGSVYFQHDLCCTYIFPDNGLRGVPSQLSSAWTHPQREAKKKTAILA